MKRVEADIFVVFAFHFLLTSLRFPVVLQLVETTWDRKGTHKCVFLFTFLANRSSIMYFLSQEICVIGVCVCMQSFVRQIVLLYIKALIFLFAGGFPYPTVQNHELLNYLKTGQRLERPDNCSETLYELMLQCWATDPEDRPNFSDICKKLDPIKSRIYIDFSELSPTYVFPPTSEEYKNSRMKCQKHSKV